MVVATTTPKCRARKACARLTYLSLIAGLPLLPTTKGMLPESGLRHWAIRSNTGHWSVYGLTQPLPNNLSNSRGGVEYAAFYAVTNFFGLPRT